MYRLCTSFSLASTSCRFVHLTRSLCASVVPYKLTDIGEGIREVEVLKVSVKPGDRVEEFDRICDVQSDKATVEITSRYSGVVKAVHITGGMKALVGMPILDIELTEEPSAESHANSSTDAAPTQTQPPVQKQQGEKQEEEALRPASKKAVLATPATRHMAQEHNIDLSQVPSTGKGGRVTKEDVLEYMAARSQGQTKTPPPPSTPTPTTTTTTTTVNVQPADETIPIVGIRRVMAKTMTEANSIPSFTASEEIEVNALISVRAQLRSAFMKRGGNPETKISLMPFLIKAASLSLRRYPVLNAHVMPGCESMVIKGSHNIGVAMDTPNGLIVPVLRDVQQKSIIDIAVDLSELVTLGRKNRLGPDHMRDATFTLSNIGPIGATYTVPVISPPQVAIGATGRLQTLPRFDAEGNVVKTTVMTVSWSADHRVIDGATLVRFGNAFKEYLETPALMIGDMR